LWPEAPTTVHTAPPAGGVRSRRYGPPARRKCLICAGRDGNGDVVPARLRILGDEAAAGIMYAPPALNRSLETRLENTIGNFAKRAAKDGNIVEAQAIAVGNTARELQHVQYNVWEKTANGQVVGGFTITLDRNMAMTEPRWFDLTTFIPPIAR
jgi:hypothetical protein